MVFWAMTAVIAVGVACFLDERCFLVWCEGFLMWTPCGYHYRYFSPTDLVFLSVWYLLFLCQKGDRFGGSVTLCNGLWGLGCRCSRPLTVSVTGI
ncbi:hypothetical protein CDAR_109231 [Caerostris darwini]|uniref:Secreted protein n=1 Tax=Caerostris darwini TaxID=1538125 RepID=A0AAV4TV14_9ARAC|nr:hypothetical protein CDAR_109231 [Caerostris darwini]